jgi:PAS domain S-box-containing protein
VTEPGYTLLALTALVALLVALVVFALVRLASVAGSAHRHRREGAADTGLLSSALQDAVTKLKQQEQAMTARATASEQLSAQILESLTAGLLVVDAAGRTEIMNAAARRLLGGGGHDVMASYRDALRTFPPIADVIAECLETNQPIVRRSVAVTSAGRSLHFGVSVSPLAGERGVICLFSDLTNVVELEEQLRLKETLAQLGELTAGIAHEFRNGLATIHGYSRLIDPDSLPVPYREYVQGIRQETESLGRVVTNFLNFARPEQISLTCVDLGAVARKAADDLRHELPDGATVDTLGTFGNIDGDEVLLRQVFSNLIRNAVQACAAAGVAPAIHIEGYVDRVARTCHVTVTDNGPGIPEGTRARVFQPFFTTRADGTGLGLAIVQKIVVMHNGRVAIGKSRTGGAALELTFPVARAA